MLYKAIWHNMKDKALETAQGSSQTDMWQLGASAEVPLFSPMGFFEHFQTCCNTTGPPGFGQTKSWPVILRLASSILRRAWQGTSSTATLLWAVPCTQGHLLWPVLCDTAHLLYQKYLGRTEMPSFSILHSHSSFFHSANAKYFANNCRSIAIHTSVNIN